MIAIVATGTSIAGPVMAFEAGAIIAPIPLLSWPIVPARLIFKTLGVDVALSATEVLLDLIESELATKEPAKRSAVQP